MAVWENAFTPDELDRLEKYGDRLVRGAALMVDSSDKKLRVTQVAWIDREPDNAWLFARIEEIVLALNSAFWRFDLYGIVECLQYTVYQQAEGGHYDWHIDHGETVEPRKLSLSLQLTDPATYEDCELELRSGNQAVIAPRARGTVIAFPSYVLHRVTPIRTGVRKSLVVWVAGPEFR